VGTDPDIATVNVQNRVSLAEALLPRTSSQTGVRCEEVLDAPDGRGALRRRRGGHRRSILTNYATITLLDAMKRVPGVGDARIFGSNDFSMRVDLDVDRLARSASRPNGRHQRDQGPERAGRHRPGRRRSR
jgi:multidrug efflux pump subunit AcrB